MVIKILYFGRMGGWRLVLCSRCFVLKYFNWLSTNIKLFWT